MRYPSAKEAYADPAPFEHAAFHTGNERRSKPRVPLHWTLYVACNGSGVRLRTSTRDINKDGFYCLLDQPVRPGEHIECDIVVPTHEPQQPGDVVYLRCRAQAVRVEKIGAGLKFGLACRIEDYCVIRGARPNLGLQEDGDGV